MTVADYIAQFLVAKGVTHVFGFQGSAMLKMLDAMMLTGKIRYIQNFHEQASAFAADAYARVTGGLGVAIATSGPGASNLLSGIADAYFDSVPVLFITGQDYLRNVVNPKGARQNGFQDMDIVSIVKPITKYSVRLDSPYDVPREFEKAYRTANEGRKGPVLVDVPIDVQFAEMPLRAIEKFIVEAHRVPDPGRASSTKPLGEFFAMLRAAERPVVIAGGGIRSASAIGEFREFIRRTGVPVVATLNGIDVYERIVGFSGLYGNSAANILLRRSDLVVALGSRFSLKQIGRNRSQYAPGAQVVHIDIDERELGRTFMGDGLNICMDLKRFLERCLKRSLPKVSMAWRREVRSLARNLADTVCLNAESVDPVEVVRAVSRCLPLKAVVTVDVGANQMWVAQAFRAKGWQRLLSSSGFGAMGFSLPAAIGASYRVKAPVVAMTGDGGLQMNLQELNTLSLLKRNVKLFVFNNGSLGLMRDVQRRYYKSHFYGNNATEFSCPDLKGLAKVYGLNYLAVRRKGDLLRIKDVFSDGLPWVVDVALGVDSKVLNRYDDEALEKHG